MTYEFPIYLSVIPILIGLIIFVISYYVFRSSRAGGAILGVFGLFIVVVFGPILFMDKVTVDETGISQETGFWFDRTQKGILFKDITSLTITTDNDRKGREYIVWVAEYKSGAIKKVDPGDLWEINDDNIVAILDKFGINVIQKKGQ